jgi:hypothetical protein
MTPMSVAGVARRTAVREVAVVSTATAASAQFAAASRAAEAKAAPVPSPSDGPLAVGTVVGKLSTGCVSAPVSGIEYYVFLRE